MQHRLGLAEAERSEGYLFDAERRNLRVNLCQEQAAEQRMVKTVAALGVTVMPVGSFRRIMFMLAGTAHHAQHGGTACA
jgi:hypothetical protein